MRNLTSSEILARARTWVAIPVKYSQSLDPLTFYKGYRKDCSGFVTMAWGLHSGLPGGGLFTGKEPNNLSEPDSLASIADPLGKALNSNGVPILATMTALQPGDILLNQGSIDPHVIIFAGWVDKTNKKIVNKPIKYTDGSYYYDGIEENFGYGETVEHTPDQPWNYPYYPGYDSEGYYAWRFDAVKAAALGYISGTPSLPLQPSGLWTKPTPLDGSHMTDKLTLAAIAFPTKKGDPKIQAVFFTLRIADSKDWLIACRIFKPTRVGSVYDCQINLKQIFKNPVAEVQLEATFNVVDENGNVNNAPNGSKIFYYTSSLTDVLNSNYNPYPPYIGNIILRDPLTKNIGAWEVTKNQYSGCVFTNKGYVSTETQGYAGLMGALEECSNTSIDASNFVFQVNTSFMENTGGKGDIEIDFRAVGGGVGQSICRFIIDADGNFSFITVYPVYNGAEIDGQSSAFKKGIGQTNLIAIVAHGTTAEIYINLHKEGSFTINPNIMHGGISLGALSQGSVGDRVIVAYNDATMWQLS